MPYEMRPFLPGFVAETKFSNDAFRLFRWRSVEKRMQDYLESVIARDDHAKEVKLFGLGPRLLGRYRSIFTRLYAEDRRLALRRDGWGFALGLVATGTLYLAYAWVAMSAVRGQISVGQMTMYLLLFRQGQTAVSAALSSVSGLYEDNLYLSTLYEYLDTPMPPPRGHAVAGPDPADGIRFEQVAFRYPGAGEDVLQDVSLHLAPGSSLALVGANGSGKSHFLRLLAAGGSDPESEHLPPSGVVIEPVRHTGVAKLGARVRPGWFALGQIAPHGKRCVRQVQWG